MQKQIHVAHQNLRETGDRNKHQTQGYKFIHFQKFSIENGMLFAVGIFKRLKCCWKLCGTVYDFKDGILRLLYKKPIVYPAELKSLHVWNNHLISFGSFFYILDSI